MTWRVLCGMVRGGEFFHYSITLFSTKKAPLVLVPRSHDRATSFCHFDRSKSFLFFQARLSPAMTASGLERKILSPRRPTAAPSLQHI